VSYYPTIEEDLARAKEILGRVNDSYQFHPKDEGDASQLLESFVAEIERLRADYTEAVRLYRERDAQAARYHDRLQIDPGGSDRIDELEAAIEQLRADALRPEYRLDYTQAKPNRYVDAVGTTGGKVTIERLNPMSLGELRRIVAAHGITRVRAALDAIEHA
jgi:hypothetical protein